MKAVVIRRPGPAEVLQIEQVPMPTPREGEVLIRVKAFGLNRSELFTRQGHSPNVSFPRILGIEAVGIVESAPGCEFATGDCVITAMGGMGRQFDGSYAEFTCVPAAQVMRIESTLDWPTLGAIPEMFQTAWGALNTALGIAAGQTLLIRGGTTSVGLAAIGIAQRTGVHVVATTRRDDRAALLREYGADDVIIDTGLIADEVRRRYPAGVDRVLELIGATTLIDSLQLAARPGVVCMTGIVGNQWQLEHFSPMTSIPTAVHLTTYSGGVTDFMNTPWQNIVSGIEAGKIKVPLGPVFTIGEIAAAHRCMEENKAGGKIVILT